MRRVDALIAVAVSSVVLGGCMRIYPDPELPDVEVEWFEGDCQPGRGDVTITLIGLDSETRVPLTVPCSDVKATFVDVARERYRFEAFLEDADGEVFSRSDGLIDLRDGIDEKVGLYFGSYSNFRVAWTFDMGAACETLEMWVLLTFSHPDGTPAFLSSAPCLLTPFFGQFLAGTYTVQLSAFDDSTTVATSPESEPFELFEDELTDLGTVTLSP